ncbi:HAD family hydrolase [Streptomyces sp. NRRL F-5123]|uniref:HAD family hydrolase n=1 Tax=Streptomyces sp. NRRL F-5123 TaxID=1463856 RepID=UPI0004E259A8|nr:HAD family hydrolase [Streptomyces sp. NRRL F-5123]
MTGSGSSGRTAAVLFDVDGTLMDTVHLHTVAWWEALRQSGRTVAMRDVQRAVGMDGTHLLDALVGEDRDREGDGGLKSAHDALYAQFWERLAPLEGAADLLRACAARGLRVVLASSASGREADVMVRALGAGDAVHAVTTSDDVAAGKPAPDVVRQALERAEAPPERAVFVGDAVWDLHSARKAGVTGLGVLTGGGYSSQELLDAGAAEVYRSPAELLDRLDGSPIGALSAGGSI